MPTVTIFDQSCKGVEDCGICTLVCPKALFKASGEMNQAGYVPPEVEHQEECTACRNCMIYCPDFAIVVESNAEVQTTNQEDEDE